MLGFHKVIAAVFAILAVVLFIWSNGEKGTPTLIALLVSNVSLAVLAIDESISRARPPGSGGFGL